MPSHTQKNILFIIDHLKGGGAEQITVDVVNNLAKKHHITVAIMDRTDIKMKFDDDITTIYLDIHDEFMKGNLWRRHDRALKAHEIAQINQIVEDVKPDLTILSHWFALHLLPHLEGNVWGWIHGEIFNPNKQPTKNLFRWYKEIRRLYFERKFFPQLLNNKNIIFVNDQLKESYMPYLPNANAVTIYNGIDQKRLNAKRDVQANKKWDCIFVARLSPEKQPELAIKAFIDSGLTGRMAIIGDGDLLTSLKEFAASHGVADRIDFLGWQTHPATYIAQSHLLIMSSLHEGFGLVIAEALLLDVPVVAFDCSHGIRYQLASPQLSRGLVPPQDCKALAEKIYEIYHDPYPISKVDKERLCIEQMIEKFEALLP